MMAAWTEVMLSEGRRGYKPRNVSCVYKKNKAVISPLELLGDMGLCQHLGFSPVARLTLDF